MNTHIVYSDEDNRLTPEMLTLMEQAVCTAVSQEFGDELAAEGMSADEAEFEVGLTIVSKDEIHQLNSEYRGIDRHTDVLSFPQFEGHEDILEDLLIEGSDTLLGDVVICFDVAEEQAAEYDTGLTREMLYLFVHSIMHLFGYDHMEEEERTEMREHEESVLSSIGVERRK